jgi:hypothetical protein
MVSVLGFRWGSSSRRETSARALRQGHVEIVHPEKQEQAVARLPMVGAHQGWMLVGSPLVKTEQDRAIRERICPKSSWAGRVSGWPKRAWYHLKLPATSPTPMIVHVRFMWASLFYSTTGVPFCEETKIDASETATTSCSSPGLVNR